MGVLTAETMYTALSEEGAIFVEWGMISGSVEVGSGEGGEKILCAG